jgi:hypothetical protein
MAVAMVMVIIITSTMMDGGNDSCNANYNTDRYGHNCRRCPVIDGATGRGRYQQLLLLLICHNGFICNKQIDIFSLKGLVRPSGRWSYSQCAD